MEQNDLTLLKHVGTSRMKLLNESGITTITQLHDIPLDKLAGIKSIGEYYAKLIKNSVSDYYRDKNGTLSARIVSTEGANTEISNRDLKRKIKKLRKNLNRVNENFKPLWKKKYLELYVAFKKRLTKLKTHLKVLVRIIRDLSDEDKSNIIKEADALIYNLKKVGKKPKKKKYIRTIQEIQSFSKMLQEIIS